MPLHALYQSNLNYRHLASGHQNTECSPILAISVGSKKLIWQYLAIFCGPALHHFSLSLWSMWFKQLKALQECQVRKPFLLNSNSRPFPGYSCLFPGYSRLTCFDAELKNGMNERQMQEKSQALIIQGQGRCLRPALPNYDSCPRGISEISCPNRQPSYPDLPKDPSCRKGLFFKSLFLSKQESFFDKNKSLFLIKIRVFFFTEMIIQLFLVWIVFFRQLFESSVFFILIFQKFA